jgi:hypothetical protein
MFDIYGIHKENRTYKDIKICFFHITDIVKTIWTQVWRCDLFELHKLKSEIAADKKLTSRKRKKKRRICSSHLVTSKYNAQISVFLKATLFLYKKSVQDKKRKKERHTKYLWRLMLIIYGAKNTVLRIQHSPFSKQFTALKTVHMKILRFLFSYGVNHFLNMGRTPWIHIYYNIEKTNHRCPTEVW